MTLDRGRDAHSCLPIGFLSAAGCQQEMADQPSYRPLQPCDFFADGRSERPAVPGTVARGHLHTDVALFTGRRVGKDGMPLGSATPTVIQPKPGTPEAAKLAKAQYDQFVDTFPFPMTEQVLEHGYQRFMIYCVVCHDPLGTGQGKIVQRGYTAPPSYHIERLRKAPVGYLFAVISEGYGSMPSYGAQIPVRDRWAIVGYLRALQASQHFPEAKLTDEMRRERSRAGRDRQGRRSSAVSSNASVDRIDTARWRRRSLWVGTVALSVSAIGASLQSRRSSFGPIWRPTCSIWASRWAPWCC